MSSTTTMRLPSVSPSLLSSRTRSSFWRQLLFRLLGWDTGDSPDVVPPTTPEPPPAPVPLPSPAPAGSKHPVSWTSWRNICSNGGWGRLNPTHAVINRALRSARWQGNLIRMDYDSIGLWPRKDMGDESDPWQSWGGVCVGWKENDTLVSGWFDHIAREGQTVKDVKNWSNGYLTDNPRAHSPLFIYLISVDGKFCTNMVRLE